MPARLPLDEQLTALRTTLSRNRTLLEVLDRTAALDLPDWYLTAGCLFQTIWNTVTGRPPTHGLSDIFDLVVRPKPVRAPQGVYETKTSRRREPAGVLAGADGAAVAYAVREKRLIRRQGVLRVASTSERRWFGRCMNTGRKR